MGTTNSTPSRKPVAVVAWIAIGAAAVALYLSLNSFSPPFNPKPHEALGRVLAEESLKLRGGGGRIFVITRDTAAFKSPGIDAQLKSFSATLKQAGAGVTSTNLMKVDPLRPVNVPAAEFLKILGGLSENDVVASFLGPPILSNAQLAQLGTKRPRVAAVIPADLARYANLKQLFEIQLLHAAILNRTEVNAPAPAADTLQAWFDHLYLLVTSANVAELPAPAGANR